MNLSLTTSRFCWHVQQYAESHQSRANQFLHFLGIPTLTISILGLLAKIPLGEGPIRVDAAWITLLAIGIWYFRQSVAAGILVSLALVACYLTGRPIPTLYLWIGFGVGVLEHLIGHLVFEHKPPAFLSHPIAILEAPAWLLTKLIGTPTQGRSGPEC